MSITRVSGHLGVTSSYLLLVASHRYTHKRCCSWRSPNGRHRCNRNCRISSHYSLSVVCGLVLIVHAAELNAKYFVTSKSFFFNFSPANPMVSCICAPLYLPPMWRLIDSNAWNLHRTVWCCSDVATRLANASFALINVPCTQWFIIIYCLLRFNVW